MEYYPDVMSEEESNSMARKFGALITDREWGFWAVENIDDNHFIGFVGLHETPSDLPVTPCVEIGWRLSKKYWGCGYASEAARASLVVAFRELNLPEVYSFTSVSNKKSQAVMQRLGMSNTNNNFSHPMVPENSSLNEHVLYKIDKKNWLEKCKDTHK